ncbi:P-type ATPase, translocating [Saccharomonospora marina XMU15]|uniref:P-type ATPase, translocating n=1 Tax=Saccharomonospora marina XMU15 TaxID=882083 RepID=H5X2N7_9PSEU|nr:HAD-IC family P-type ATPase [Saccharomonospora marina]EHR50976.1 P-type ATPase, translocating [Saccharomonospora marina XMU15]
MAGQFGWTERVPTTARAEQSNSHHDLPIHESVLLLQTDPDRGLSEQEARERETRFGPNALPQTRPTGPLLRLLRQLHHPLIYVLLVAGAVTLLLGEHVDSAVIFGVVFVNMIVGFVQESRAEAALDALRAMVRTEAKVVRGGVSRTVPSERLVPGDLVLVEAGDRVPADLRLVRLSELAADESALTGESEPVVKDEVVLPPATPVADRRNMLHSGTLVTSGSGAGIVVATGAETELGEIHRLVGTAEVLQTPLTRKLAWFSKVLTVVILLLAAVTFAIGVVRGESGVEMFTAAVALAVGAIPEGLPAAVTITLAIGVSRMARRRAVIRRLPAVETLGSTTVICSDKTGTLTENQMTVSRVWTPQGDYGVSGAGYTAGGDIVDSAGEVLRPDTMPPALRWTLLAGAACNDAALHRDADTTTVVGDPTEAAMLVAARKAGLLDVPPRTGTIPFSSQRQYMATLHTAQPNQITQPDQHGHVVFVKGAVERVLALCGAELGPAGPRPLEEATALRAAEDLASQGLRVLATAMAQNVPAERFGEDALAGSLVFTGLQAMFDPPRPAAASAVRSCREAGIAVKMITGDHAATATAIAGRIDLLDGSADGKVLTGAELAELSEDRLPDAVRDASVFARVSPEQKLRLVEAMQSRSEVVAMTGDGVNDAPALRQADIGVAMGRGGTEVAKEAGDMVLTDDDFATIEAAVEEGRGVFDNLTKFIVWTLPTNMAEGLVILVAIFAGAALPILPTQILWINMTTAVALGLMLAFEPKERGIMRRPPRDPRRPLLTGGLVARILLVSALLVGGSWWMFQWELAIGSGLPEARTVALNLFVAVELFYLFSCRSLTRSVWRIGWFSNKWVLGGVTFQILAQAALTYLPVMQGLFDTAPIGLESWLRILGVAALASVVVGVHKRLFPQVL